MKIEIVSGDLPAGFDELRAEARAEGLRQIERLATEWNSRTTRFGRDSEALLAVRVNGTLAGIGGLTIEPVVPNALRMRRFYVRPAFRRGGVGRELVLSLLTRVRSNQVVTANAAPGSVPFWEAMGFTADPRDGHTHILNRTIPMTPGQLVSISSPMLPALVTAAGERASMRLLEFFIGHPEHGAGRLP